MTSQQYLLSIQHISTADIVKDIGQLSTAPMISIPDVVNADTVSNKHSSNEALKPRIQGIKEIKIIPNQINMSIKNDIECLLNTLFRSNHETYR